MYVGGGEIMAFFGGPYYGGGPFYPIGGPFIGGFLGGFLGSSIGNRRNRYPYRNRNPYPYYGRRRHW